MSARSNWPTAGSRCVASSVVSVGRTSITTRVSSDANAARVRASSGNAVTGLPPTTNRVVTWPASISLTNPAHGHSPKRRGSSGRLGGPGSGTPSDATQSRSSRRDRYPGLNHIPPGRS